MSDELEQMTKARDEALLRWERAEAELLRYRSDMALMPERVMQRLKVFLGVIEAHERRTEQLILGTRWALFLVFVATAISIAQKLLAGPP